MNTITDNNKSVLERLTRSQIYQDYERAFGEATGLPLTLTPVEDMQLAHHRRRHESPFCALMASQNKACAACLRTQHELATAARDDAKTVVCFAGLCETAIPLRVGENLIGFLRTGEVLQQTPTQKHFARIARQLTEMGLKGDETAWRDAYFQSRVFSPKQYESVVNLLRIFAQHLAIVANQVVFRIEHVEPPQMTRAREYIAEHAGEDVTLTEVANAAHMSVFYFCKQFKKATGVSFTSYLGRVRVEKAKQMLLNPHTRVSEVAFECGFQSITHFNRIFRKVAGESPTSYRTSLPFAKAA